MKIGALLATTLISVAAAVLWLVFGKWSPDKGCLTSSTYWEMRQAVVGMSGSEVISKLGEPASSKDFPLWIWLPEEGERRVRPGTHPQDIIGLRQDFHYVLFDRDGRVAPPGIRRRHEREPEPSDYENR